MNSYEEITPAMQKQVDSTIWLLKNNLFPHLEERAEVYIREHLSNLVQSCTGIARKQSRKRKDVTIGG